MISENQAYIHYRKGSLVMYALQDLIGEDVVNQALRNFIAKHGYSDGPFPTAENLVQEFRAVAGAEHQDLITDLFEKITLYDFSVTEASVEEVADGWQVTFDTAAKKYYADGTGVETEAPMDSWVDIAVFPEDPDELGENQLPQPLYIEKRRVQGDGQVSVTVAERPYRVGIDPCNKMIDRNPEDNLKTL